MPGAAKILIGVWLATAAATALPGWLVVRYLPAWASLPVIVILVLVTTAIGIFGVVAAVPGDSAMIKRTSRLYSLMFPLIIVSPTIIAVSLFKWFCVG